MNNLSLVLFAMFIFFILILLLFNYKKLSNRSPKTNCFSPLIRTSKELEFNPDINTNNWDLHKNRLKKFGRSQYNGLTFFISSEDRIYYLSEKGTKIYC